MSDSSQLLSADRPAPTFLILPRGVIGEGLQILMDADDRVDVVGTADSWDTARPRIAATQPEVVLLADLPLDGTPVCCAELRNHYPDIATLLLADKSDPQQLLDALNSGISGYVLKSISSSELAATISHLAAGGSLISPKLMGSLLKSIREPPPASPLAVLTNLEREVLKALATGATNRQIGRRLNLSEKTVKNYISSILHKLDLNNRVEAAVLLTKLASPDA